MTVTTTSTWTSSDMTAEDVNGGKIRLRYQKLHGDDLIWEASSTSAGITTRRYESSRQGAVILLLNDLAKREGG